MQYERAVHRAIEMNALTQFSVIIFCGELQYSKLIEAFSLPVKRVSAVEKVEAIVFSKQGFRSHFRDCRIKDAEYAVSPSCKTHTPVHPTTSASSDMMMGVFHVQVVLWINTAPRYGTGLQRYGLFHTVVPVLKSNAKQLDPAGKVVNSCEKSPSFAEAVILMFSDAGDTVLELCGGTGAFTKSALLHGRNAVYVEKDGRQVDHVHKLLQVFPLMQRRAFLKQYRLPVSDLLPVSYARASDGSYENPYAYIPWRRAERAGFSVMSKERFTGVLVSERST